MDKSISTENHNKKNKGKSKRTKSRELAVQMLYSSEITGDKIEDTVVTFFQNPYIGELEINDGEKDSTLVEDDKFISQYTHLFEFAEELFKLAMKNKVQDEDMISKFISKNRTLDRIGVLEKCVLRLGISELFQDKTPSYAVINEYVTIAKNFSGEKSASLVKAVLENIKTKFSLGENNNEPK